MEVQLVQAGAVAYGDVIDLVGCIFMGCSGCAQVGLYGVFDVAKVTTGFAISVDVDWLVLDHGEDPFGDHGCIGAVWVLAAAEDVEIPKTDGFKSVGFGEDISVQLVDQFSYGIRREGLADLVFNLGQVWVVTVGRAAGGVDKAFDLRVPCSNQHVQESVNVVLVGGDGVFDAAWDGTEGGLVEDVIHMTRLRTQCRGLSAPKHGVAAVVKVTDVALDEVEIGPLVACDQALDFVQVSLVAGAEVV